MKDIARPAVVLPDGTTHVAEDVRGERARVILVPIGHSLRELRQRDEERLAHATRTIDRTLAAHRSMSYNSDLVESPPGPDGGPTYRSSIAGTRVRVIVDIIGRVLEPDVFRDDLYDMYTYWKPSGQTFDEAMQEEVDAFIGACEAERDETTERLESNQYDVPLVVAGWYENTKDAHRALKRLRAEGEEAAALHFVNGVLDRST